MFFYHPPCYIPASSAGRKVWHLRVDVHVLDHAGNLVDACGLASLAALMAFRRPDVTVGGGDDGQVCIDGAGSPDSWWLATGQTWGRTPIGAPVYAAPAVCIDRMNWLITPADHAALVCPALWWRPLLPMCCQAVTVHPPEVREPVPLSIHHLPLPISFALFEVRGSAGAAAAAAFCLVLPAANCLPGCAANAC